VRVDRIEQPAPALSLLRAARSRQAIGIASAKWIGTGAKMRLTDVYDRGRQHRPANAPL